MTWREMPTGPSICRAGDRHQSSGGQCPGWKRNSDHALGVRSHARHGHRSGGEYLCRQDPPVPRRQIRASTLTGQSARSVVMRIHGSCSCGFIAFEADADPEKVTICHCTDCQSSTGTAFRTNVPVTGDTFKMLSGTPTIYVKTTAASGNPRAQAFCPRCGSPIYSTTPGDGPSRSTWCASAFYASGISSHRECRTGHARRAPGLPASELSGQTKRARRAFSRSLLYPDVAASACSAYSSWAAIFRLISARHSSIGLKPGFARQIASVSR